MPGLETATSAICKVRMFKGDHFFIRNLDQDFIHMLGTDILQTIAGAIAEADIG